MIGLMIDLLNRHRFIMFVIISERLQGRIQDFKLGGGAHLKKLRRAEGGPNIFGVFRVKNHYFTPKNHIFSNCRGGGGGGARAGCAPSPGSAPGLTRLAPMVWPHKA